MARQTSHVFQKGVNKRVDIERTDDPNRLYTLQNARLFKRGETGYVSRIEGYENILTEALPDNAIIKDIKAFGDTTIIGVFFLNGDYTVFIVNRNNGVKTTIGSFSDSEVKNVKLLIQENTVYISPFNKQIDLIDGQWYLNDTVSTSPLFNVNLSILPETIQGSITVNDDIPETGNLAEGSIEFISGVLSSQEIFITIGGDISVDFLANEFMGTQSLAQETLIALTSDQLFNERYSASRTGSTVDIIAKEPGAQYNAMIGVSPTIAQINNLEGGSGDETPLGSIFITVDEVTVNTVNILTGDNRNVIAEKIFNAINASLQLQQNFSFTLNDNIVELERTTISGFNTEIIVDQSFLQQQISINVSDFPGFELIGALRPEEDYWYTVRYVYRDGHRTKTSYPKKVRTSNIVRSVTLNIEGNEDLKSGDFADVEVFRRLESGEFFFIRRVDGDENMTFVDDGVSNIRPLDEQNYVWSETHQTHEIVRDRYVRANVDYKDTNYEGRAEVSVVPKPKALDIGTPINTQLELFSRPRFEDGTESFFSVKDTHDITESGNLRIEHDTFLGSKPIKEVGYYGTYKPLRDVDVDTIDFSSFELANVNIPTIATHDEEDEALQDRPVSPRILLGFKQFTRISYRITSERMFVSDEVYDEDFGALAIDSPFGGPTEEEALTNQQWLNLGAETLYPTYVEKEIIKGVKVLYKKIYEDPTPFAFQNPPPRSAVYEIAWISGLSEYIGNTNLNVSLIEIPNNISSTVSNSQYLQRIETSLGFIDETANYIEDVRIAERGITTQIEYLVSRENSKFYLTFSPESLLSNVTNPGINFNTISEDFEVDNPINSTFKVKMLNVNYKKDLNPVIEEPIIDGVQVRRFSYKDKVIQTVPDIAIEDGTAIYLGSTKNQSGVFNTNHTGFKLNETDNFRYWTLDPSNIYSIIIEEKDLENLRSEFPNQLIWSQPFLLGTNVSGARTFEFNAVLDIARDYGPIVDIRYVRNDLVVFCERGVARVNVGEVLTQQPSGSTFIDTSRFLTGFFWILKNVPRIEVNSIVEFEHNLFFSDGLDIWMFSSDGLMNVSLGSVDLNQGAKLYGCIDPENKEYRLFDGKNTWSYNFEVQEFMGPHTYGFTSSTNVRDKLYTVTDQDKIVVHNTGNDFDGEEYETIIESVSNDLNEPSIEKLFRKFYVDMENEGEFSYGKKYGEFVTPFLSGDRLYENIGVKSSQANSPRMFWRVTSTAENFVLKMISFIYSLRRRR